MADGKQPMLLYIDMKGPKINKVLYYANIGHNNHHQNIQFHSVCVYL